MSEEKSNPDSQQEVINTFNRRRQELQMIIAKVNQLDQERMEHDLVLKTLKGLEPGRRCFRLINNVLCERTVKDVTPAVDSNRIQINEMIERLTESLKSKETELAEYKRSHGIVIRGEDVPRSAKA